MAIAEYNYEDFQSSQQQEQDEKLLVKFYTKPIKDVGASAEAGRPIFKEREYVDIRIPGSRDGAARPATHRDKQRFPKHYAAFKQRIELPETGTPLTEWPGVSRSQAEEMAFYNIKTVEQLANLNDNIAGNFMGAQSFKAKAKKWLEHCRTDVTIEQLSGELASRDKMLAELQEQITALTERIDA